MHNPYLPADVSDDDIDSLCIRVDAEDRWNFEPSNIRRRCQCGNLLDPESFIPDCEQCEDWSKK